MILDLSISCLIKKMILLQKKFYRNNFNFFQPKIIFKYVVITSIKKCSSNNISNKSVYYHFKFNFLNKNIKLQSITFQLKTFLNQKFLKHVKLKLNCFQTLQNGTLKPKNNFSNFKILSAFKNFKTFYNFESKYLPLRKKLLDFKSKKYNNFQIKTKMLMFFNLFGKNINSRIETFKVELKNRSPFFASFSAVGLFSWDDNRITDEDIKKEVNEIMSVFSLNDKENNTTSANFNDRSIGKIDFERNRLINDEEWKLIYDKKDLIIWKRKIVGLEDEIGDLFEYKVLGRMYDITPLEFFQTQVDLDFRKQWDYLVVILDMIEKDVITNTELIRWVMRFPYPLYPREYVYVRRYCIDPKEHLLILVSRSLPELEFKKVSEENNPEIENRNRHYDELNNQNSKKYVRITNYKSNIIVIPHSDFDKPGINYVIQYYDINKAQIPKVAYNWMAASGLPDFIDRLHSATIKLRETKLKENKNAVKELKEELEKYDVIYLNEEKCKNEKGNTDNSSPPKETSQNNKPPEITTDKEVSSQTNSDKNIIIEKLPDNKYQFYLEQIIKQLNSDFFSENEPHEIFFNF